MKNKKCTVLYTGASGQMGQSFKDIIDSKLNSEFEFVGLDRDQLDITSDSSFETAITQYSPNIVINFAAYTNVEKAEDEQEKVRKVNTEALKMMAEHCSRNNIILIHLSTDYVFDGNKGQPYLETDQVCPQNIYGKTKADGENIVLSASDLNIVIRTSWIFGPHGNNFFKTILNLMETRDKLTIVSDQQGAPTYSLHLAECIYSLVIKYAYDDVYQGGVYHFSGLPYCSWYEFAQFIVNEAKKDIEVLPCRTSDFSYKAIRPSDSRLDMTKLNSNIPHLKNDWRDGVRAMLKR